MAQTYTTPSRDIHVPDGIVIPGNIPFARDYGDVLRAMLNRIKMTSGDFSAVHRLEVGYVKDVIAGREAPNAALLTAIEKSSPLSVRELVNPRYWHRVPVHDDSTDGVVVFRSGESTEKMRIHYRRDRMDDQSEVKYYTYFHAAVQKHSPIVPEKIVVHYEWDPINTELPDCAFNNGHRERQITVTVGTVNYHWIDSTGKKHVIETHTGDANAISPFTRHSFTVPPGREGYIVAVTDLGAIGNPDFRALLHALQPTETLQVMQRMLPADDPVSSFDHLGGFMFQQYDPTNRAFFSQTDYQIYRLMVGITSHPFFAGFEIHPVASSHRDHPDLNRDAPIFGYNHGQATAKLVWGSVDGGMHTEEIKPGDSFSIQKSVSFGLRSRHPDSCKIILVKSNPAQESPLEQLLLIRKFAGEEGLSRVASESEVWFKEAKKE